MIRKLIRGTCLLTIAGFITRLMGFFYRIFLANSLGEKNLGIYQMIFPVYTICFTLYGASLQTTVSQLVAGKYNNCRKKTTTTALILSLSIALILSFLLYFNSTFVACYILHEPSTTHLLKILSILFPFCATTSICSGYFYGIQLSHVPALAQIIEQIVRITFVLLIFITHNALVTCSLCTWGLVCGEIASQIFCLIYFCFHKDVQTCNTAPRITISKHLFKQTLPLCGTRLALALLTSLEAILLPLMLTQYGFSKDESLRLFGVFTGIVIPFLLFPGTITNSLSVLLLPEISKAKEEKNKVAIQKATYVTMKYSFILGCIATSVLLFYGTKLGIYFFHSENAGKLLTLSSIICPFLYASTTQTSIITGLNYPQKTFAYTLISLLFRILCLLTLTPFVGIYGYLFGFISSQIVLYVLCSHFLNAKEQIQLSLPRYLIFPFLLFELLLYITNSLLRYLFPSINLVMIIASCTIAGTLFLAICIRLHIISQKDLYEIGS